MVLRCPDPSSLCVVPTLASMQMHVGSIHETDDEQGVAHFVEHVTFLGSTKRESLLSLGVRSNAYTDFHHTVFHMSSELKNDLYNMEMLPHVIDALAEIAFRAEFLRTRIEKERKAVLAEAQMMNTIEYRMDCQLLGYLHEENELGNRFPIGLVDQVRPPPRHGPRKVAADRSSHIKGYALCLRCMVTIWRRVVEQHGPRN